MRLDKYLSDTGMGRAQARALILQGRVRVEDQTAARPGQAVAPGQRVTVDGRELAPPGPLHLMMNKPAGVVTAQEDSRFKTVFDLLPEACRRRGLCAVGRLDRDTTGLLLFTTDGQLAHRLISPRFTVEKSYLAWVEGRLTQEHVTRMAQGIALKDFTARPAKMEILEPNLARLTVTEGKYHQVKRMFGALGCPVTRLHRERVGPLTLDSALAPGQARPLTPEESAALCQLTRWEAT